LLQSDYMYTSGSHIVNYHRYSQSLKSLELAAAEYAGLVVAPFTSTISQILYFEDSTILVTIDGVIRLPGFQEDFAIGDIVVKDTIMGGGFSLLGREDANDSSTWYKAMDWSDGLSLAGVTPFPGLVIPNDISLAEAYEYNAEHDNFHVRFTMSGDTDQAEAFFARIKRVEVKTGWFLNDLFGFTTLNETTTFYPIDFYFELLLSNKAIVALVDTTIHSPAVRERLVEFLVKNKPVGSVVITRNDVRANVYLPPNGGIVWFAIGDDEAFSPWEEAVFVVS